MFKSFRTRLTLITALALLSSATCFGQADSTMRRSFTPAVMPLPAGATTGYSQLLTQQSLQSQGIGGSPSGSSPMIAYGPFRNTSSAALTVSLTCIEGADRCIIYGAVNGAAPVYENWFQVGAGQTYQWFMRDYGYVTVAASQSGLSNADVGLPANASFDSPTVVSASNTYKNCLQGGTDNGDGTFTPSGGYIFYYSTVPTRSDRSYVYGGGPVTTTGPNPGVSTSTCAPGVGTYSGGAGGGGG